MVAFYSTGLLAPAIACLWLWAEWRLKIARQQVRALSICPAFGCLTRQGASIHWRGIERRANQSIIFFDLDDMKSLNQRHTYEGMNVKIRAVCAQLEGLIVRWFSGDEFVLYCNTEDAPQFAARIERLFLAQGIGLMWAIAPLTGSTLEQAVQIASELVLMEKSSRIKK